MNREITSRPKRISIRFEELRKLVVLAVGIRWAEGAGKRVQNSCLATAVGAHDGYDVPRTKIQIQISEILELRDIQPQQSLLSRQNNLLWWDCGWQI